MNADPQKKFAGNKRLLILAAVILALLAVNIAVPRKRALPQLSARTLKDLAELATVEYSVTKIVSYKDVAWYGDRKILFETAATVKAGIDLNELVDQDIKLDGDSAVTVSLPQPKILLFNMKPEHMREIFNESGILRSDFSNQEKDGLLSQGEKDIRAMVARMDILERAARNARILVESWLKKMGFATVHVVFKGKGGRT
jgi:tRNA(Glu) U13 pseudouridine synthase TruD